MFKRRPRPTYSPEMTDPRTYLLYTTAEEEEFRKEFSVFIAKMRAAYQEWINGLPMWEWIRFLDNVPEDKWRLVTGMICIVYIEGLVNISVSNDGFSIRREPRNEKEHEYLMKKLGFKKISK